MDNTVHGKLSRPEYWSGQPFLSPGDLPNSGIEPRPPVLQADCLPAEPQGKLIHLIRTDSNFRTDSFLWLSNIPLYKHHNSFIHSCVDGHLGCFHILALVNSAGMNNGIHMSFSIFVSSWYMPRSGITGSYGILLFYACFQTSWARNQCKVLMYSIQDCAVKYTKAQPLVEDACM